MNKEILIPVEVGGIRFKNPFYVASGPTAKSVRQLKRIEETGWAAASIKLTIDPAPYVNRAPRYAIFEDRNALCFTAEKRLTFEQGLKLVYDAKKELRELILMANITYAGDAGVPGWVNMAVKFEEAGADIIELNMCCPNMSYNLELTTGDESASSIKTGASLGQQSDAVAEIVREIKKAVRIPVFVKLTPEGGQIAKIAKALYTAGADAVGGTANRLGIPPIDLDNPSASAYHLQDEISMSCHSGAWLKPLAQRDVYEIRKVNGPEARITAAGGIRNERDALEMIMCGADLLGICAETLISGYGFIGGVIAGMKGWMDERGIRELIEIRDRIVPEVKTALELTIYNGYAKVKEPKLAAPCVSACPMHVPVQAYVRKAASGAYREAYDTIMSAAPLQEVCGQVCDRACERHCTRGIHGQPIHIREIKRFVLEYAAEQGWKPNIACAPPSGKRAAVIGSGPAGLSCAYHLALEGVDVNVFERESRFGGMLTHCLPAFRLSSEVVAREIERLRSIGVKFESNTALGRDFTLDSLKAYGFDTVFLGIGAQKGRGLSIPGEEALGVEYALDYLRGSKQETGNTVVVLGGGFSAVDAARTARRRGAGRVYLAYRRTREEMPASWDEVAEAEEEGIRVLYLIGPTAIFTENGKLTGVELRNHTLAGPDNSGRRSPEEVACTSFAIPCDTLVLAIGQEREEIPGVGFLTVDPLTMQTNIPCVFAGGDSVKTANIVSAAAQGRRAAKAMSGFMSGGPFAPEPSGLPAVDPETVLCRTGYYKDIPRTKVTMSDGTERVHDFRPYTRVLTEAEVKADAARCLSCGCGPGCSICKSACSDFAIELDDNGRIRINEDECVACGMCYNRCPNKNIEMICTGDTSVIKI